MWNNLNLSSESKRSISELGFETATRVQIETIPHFTRYKDVAVEAETGSGKTLAFVVSIFEILTRAYSKGDLKRKHDIGALILSPTRELALQTHDLVTHFIANFPAFSVINFIGGRPVSSDVANFELSGGTLVIATPGRMEEILFGRKNDSSASNCIRSSLRSLEVLVLDEADRLLESGFASSINLILEALPKQRRTGLFSATQTKKVEDLMRAGLRNPISISLKTSSATNTPDTLDNYYFKCPIGQYKLTYLVSFLTNLFASTPSDDGKMKVMVFLSTCSCVEYFSLILNRIISKKCSTEVLALHGRKKSMRHKMLESFKKAKRSVLICTDVMGRGIDVPSVDWVIQFDVPKMSEYFVHRCGRTARIGEFGQALTFLMPHETSYIDFIERNQNIRLDELCFDFCNENGFKSLSKQIRGATMDWQRHDRSVLDLATLAFVSHIQAYTKHECNYILRVKDLPWTDLIYYFGLLKVPRMPELKKVELSELSDMMSLADTDHIPYRDKCREEARQRKKREISASKENFQKRCSQPWSLNCERTKRKRDIRNTKENQELKKTFDMEYNNNKNEDDLDDDLDEDYKMCKKAKKGKVSQQDYDEQIGLVETED